MNLINSLCCTLLIIGISTSTTGKIRAQGNENYDGKYFLGNVGINGIVGGIGALFNKKPGEKGGKVLLKGFAQGCLGGCLQFTGKKLIYQVNKKESIGWVWPARIVNAAGSSITYNAVSNRNFWESWHINLWAFRFDYDLTTDRFRTRLHFSGLTSLYQVGSRGKFKLLPSLASGVLLFEGNNGFTIAGGSSAQGIAWGTTVGYPSSWKENGTYYEWMAHEFAHVLQYDNFAFFNALLIKQSNYLDEKSSFYRDVSKYFILDLNGPGLFLNYLMQSPKAWECRAIERGADYFGRKVSWPRCN